MDSDGGKKFDDGKPRLDLVPKEAIWAMARGLTYGAQKYGDHNWRKGIDHNRLYAAALRHLTAYWEGETNDPESGLCHLDHALVNLAMMVSSPEYDNRYKEE